MRVYGDARLYHQAKTDLQRRRILVGLADVASTSHRSELHVNYCESNNRSIHRRSNRDDTSQREYHL
jgi:hypothetical protein